MNTPRCRIVTYMANDEKIIQYRSIGVIHTPFKEPKGTPIQPQGAVGIKGQIEIFDEFADGLTDLNGFSHIILLYHFHECHGFALKVKRYAEEVERGVFATRAPKRPNPIGISVVRLVSASGQILEVEDMDILNGTPLLDIKPYIPIVDCRQAERIGWVSGKTEKISNIRADNRFSNGS